MLIILLIYSISAYAQPMKFKFSGEAYSFNTILIETNFNNPAIENIKNNIFLKFQFYIPYIINGFVNFNFNTDQFVSFSYSSTYGSVFHTTQFMLGIDSAILNYKKNLLLFYKERVFDFNDGLRILDDITYSFCKPVIFYSKPIPQYSHFGKYYLGLLFKKSSKFINQQLLIASPYYYISENSGILQYLIASRTGFNINIFKLYANLVYKQQNFPLPEVNKENWAEFWGTWYEFDTSSFYKPSSKDYELISTMEISFKKYMFTFWAEAGIKRKIGGYFLRATMMATETGNIEVDYIWSSPEWNYFIAGTGIQVEFAPFLFEIDYKLKSGESTSFKYDSYYNNLIINTNRPVYNEINLKLKLPFNIINPVIEVFSGRTLKDYLNGLYLDDYNFEKYFYFFFLKEIKGARAFNTIDFDIIKFNQKLEMRQYEFYYYDINTIEMNTGIESSFTKKLEVFANLRYKKYIFEKKFYLEETYSNSFKNIFAGIRYRISDSIYIGFNYGIEPEILYDRDYGFEYVLMRYIYRNTQISPIDTIFNAEEYYAKNHFFTIYAKMQF